MIPILYSSTEKDYTHNGIAPLKESIEATVTEEANGLLELYLEYPINGMWSREIKDQMLIKAKPNDLDEPHVFRIYEIVKNMEEQLLYIYASSKTNDLGLDLVQSATVTNGTGQEAMNVIKANLTQGTTLTLGSDIVTRSSTSWSMRNPLNCIVGEEGSIVQWWGGELKRNNDGLYLYARRGRDNVAVIRQGKNLEGFDMTVSTQGLITRILPHATVRNEETGEESEIIGSIVDSPRVGNYPVRRIVAVDYTDESITTVAQLNSAAASYFTDRNPDSDKPTVRFKIDMVQLSNTSYYAKFKKLESVGVFDTVTVYVPKFDVNVNVKIRSVEYDVLREKTIRIVAGDAVSDIFKDIRNDYTSIINDTKATLHTIIQQAANGNNRIWRGISTPVPPHKKGDLWYKPVGEHMVMLQWDGLTWVEILNTEDMESVKRAVDAAVAEAEAAKQAAEQSYTDSVAEAERLVQVQTDAFNAQMTGVNKEISTVKTNIDTAIANVNQEIANNFTSLSDSISDVDDIATQAKSDAQTALSNASTVQANLTVEAGKISALTTRVSGSETNISNVTQTVSGINTTISTLRTDVNGKATIVSLNQVKSTADGNKTTISNHAGRLTTVETNVNGLQSTVADKADKSQITQLSTSISTKVESATYNSKMTQLDNAINLRVVQGDVTAAILADKKIKDTRTTNQLPSWYFANYKSQRVEEFKSRTVVGVPGSSLFVKLVTDVPWSDGSGGVIIQTAYSSDGVFNRSGNAAGTAWGSWVKQTDSSNVLSQVNLSTEGVLIQGKRIQLDGDVTMTAAYVTKLNTQTLTAITANITSIRSKVLVTDSVTSTHIKAENALIDGIFGTTALITRLTSKTAFINNIKAITISADKVTTGTLNAANVSIINLNASNIVTGTLDGITVRSSFNYAYDGAILNQGATTIGNGQITSMGTFTHSHGSTYLKLSPDGLYGDNLYPDLSIRSLFRLDGKGLTLRTGVNIATYNHTGIDFGRGSMRYYSADARIEIGSYNGAALGSFVGGNYLRRITVGGGNDGLNPFVDLWATTTMRATLNVNFNQITNANHISGASTILFHNTSNRLVQSSDGQLNLLSPNQINLGWTNGSSVTNVLSLTTNQVSMFRNLNMQSNNVTNQSDRRLKTDIAPTSIVALDAYRRLVMVDYRWIDSTKPSGRHLGVIAQDTPFWSMYDVETDTWLINSSKQIMYNSLGIKELVSIADRHTSDITRINTFVTQHELEIQLLKDRITQLEEQIA